MNNTVLLDDDDTSIVCISNGDIFKIDEYIDVDTSLSETLLLKYINSELINFKCQSVDEGKLQKYLPVGITFLKYM